MNLLRLSYAEAPSLLRERKSIMHVLVRALEGVFCVGMVGSLVVAILAFVGDIHVLFEKDRGQAN
jgi:hypothetical protein